MQAHWRKFLGLSSKNLILYLRDLLKIAVYLAVACILRQIIEDGNYTRQHLKKNIMWEEKNNQLCRIFTFKDFSEAFAFMTRVALIAEKLNHHPNWSNTWNTVDIKLSTHDAGDIVTDKDRALAKAIDKLVA